jgi:hypothetical protein
MSRPIFLHQRLIMQPVKASFEIYLPIGQL